MSLGEKLAAISAAGAAKMPEEVRATMGKATQELRESGILDRTIKVGDTLPAFSLENADGAMINSADLLSKGAVVLTVFRGHW
ncbi:MAG: hypothetical protein HOK98_07220 [Rhodospirillaceae bacterium]|jgi:hypothetical protein|nr:hypothetical protein [Rhodospirillaceae bacterium]MBT5943440.1 hypothetical protein [Rhodospirillaceae bacterium]MBT6405161.1 hypothetical protein [Rhodospirillaceae bacterium]MBT6535959.1 hypothetical protein [Rhodospirillaceae bacterium]MBT7362423.1 hypothetical protein [Rhodospirillaceae bacterium]